MVTFKYSDFRIQILDFRLLNFALYLERKWHADDAGSLSEDADLCGFFILEISQRFTKFLQFWNLEFKKLEF
ncbi:hypothetical protein RT99_09115 [Flavobacterium sp. MEB061]|nr:hypothetical protein RT99_09115 [Flavobacterium sp. MEB061]